MRKNGISQWLQYLTALSLTLSTSAYSLPASAAPAGDNAVSPRAASTLNDMAQTQAGAMDPATTNDWLQIIWAQWTRIIIIIIEQTDNKSAQTPSDDFGSYAALLDTVKNEA